MMSISPVIRPRAFGAEHPDRWRYRVHTAVWREFRNNHTSNWLCRVSASGPRYKTGLRSRLQSSAFFERSDREHAVVHGSIFEACARVVLQFIVVPARFVALGVVVPFRTIDQTTAINSHRPTPAL